MYMKLIITNTIFFLILAFSLSAADTTIVYRSEYENAGDEIYDLNAPDEGNISYSIIKGNDQGYYTIGSSNGIVSMAGTINDEFNVVHYDTLTIDASDNNYVLIIVDGYDYFLQNNPAFIVLDEHNQTYYEQGNEYTGYNNLWGKGTAVPNVDFRMATLLSPDLPDSTVFIWDVPSPAGDFGGASVWSYINVMWGNRKNVRDDLSGFPFKWDSLMSLNVYFEFEKLFGTDDYKIALNNFFTDESELSEFSANDGDFFFVFDQRGTWVPNYPVDIGDTIIDGMNFARLYKEEDGYEWRRVIIRDDKKWLKGILDLHRTYKQFSNRGYLNKEQYIPNIQIGIEVTDGFGAVRVNHWRIKPNEPVGIKDNPKVNPELKLFPNPSHGVFRVETSKTDIEWSIYNITGSIVKNGRGRIVDITEHPPGIYFLKTDIGSYKMIKK